MRPLKNLLRRAQQREEGQAAFEFMLILPTFILFFVMVVDFGILMYEHVSVANAAREAARYGAVNCGDGDCTAADITGRAMERSGGIVSDAADVTVGWVDRGTTAAVNDRGDSIVVSIDHEYDFLFFPVTVNVRSCADMRLEQRDDGTVGAGSSCP
jgi:hypothetical protein